MRAGKIPNDDLKRIVLDKIKHKREEVIIRPKVGEDCTAIDFGRFVCVLSCDPITGAAHEIGKLAVHVACNDIASCGVEPLGLMVVILAPLDAKEEDLDIVMKQISDTASLLNVEVIGGHTEITPFVTRFILSCTAVGRALKEKLVTTSGAKPGDSIIVTKFAGMEGTAILAYDKEEELKKYIDPDTINRAKGFIDNISVVKEGIIAGEFGVSAMHDVTEGGVLGALWELAEASDVGLKIWEDKIPICEETYAISQIYNINPLKLISSGCMLIACKRAEELVKILKNNGISASIIGEVTEDKSRVIIYKDRVEEIEPPVSDELYKAIGS